jgi:hypothetical protein
MTIHYTIEQPIAQQILEKLAELTGEVSSLRDEIQSLKATPNKTLSEYLTVQEAAAEFKVCPRTLYKLKPLHTRFGRLIRFRRVDLERHLRHSRLK